MAHHNLGNALRLKGKKTEALVHFRCAVDALPENAEARNNLGQSLLERGDLNEMFAQFREAVRLRPGFAPAHSNLGATLRELGRLDEAQACYREAMRLQPSLAAARVGLGGVLEELGEYDQAVSSDREALRTDPQHAGALARLATLLRDSLRLLDRAAVQRLAHHHLGVLDALSGSADRVVDKMPENSLYLGLIATRFPRAKIIHVRRDARDLALSCWMTNFTQLRWASDPLHITSRIAEADRLMAHWKQVLPIPMLDVEYEALVDDVERISRRLVAWCGLDWDPACLEFHKTRRAVRTPSANQVRKPVYRGSVGRWRNYQPFLGPLFAGLMDQV